MSISSTVLIFLLIPLGVMALVASLVMGGSDRARRSRRYRPGRPYDFQPIWFLASPEQVTGKAVALAGQSARPALAGSAGQGSYLEDSTGARILPGPTGGASDSW
ncbi:MAG TPA: hypothetical protein VGB74_21570 [Actinoplanes sp.]